LKKSVFFAFFSLLIILLTFNGCEPVSQTISGTVEEAETIIINEVMSSNDVFFPAADGSTAAP